MEQNQSHGNTQHGPAQTTESSFNWDTFEVLTRQLRASVERFQSDQTPENFAGIITVLSGYGASATQAWRTTADYTRKNPVRVAALAGILFFAIKGFFDAGKSKHPSLPYH